MPREITEATTTSSESTPATKAPQISEGTDDEFQKKVLAFRNLYISLSRDREIRNMASPVPGVERLYVGGLHVLNQSSILKDLGVTHILSVLKFELKAFQGDWEEYEHLVIDVDDVEDENLLERFEETGEWIEKALKGGGVVYVHCLMGMSRSVTIIIAYLLRLHRTQKIAGFPSMTPAQALASVQKSRPIASPNDGFMAQLNLYKEMGCPKDIESHPRYQRWLYMRGVEEATAAGVAPEWILFEDEENGKVAAVEQENVGKDSEQPQKEVELRCRKCRRTLATTPYLTTHIPKSPNSNSTEYSTTPISSFPPAPTHNLCTHHFLHPLSWMRPELEQGLLSGRLECPNAKCKAQIGRYAWQGMKCSCGIWVCPAFSLAKGRVDERELPRTSGSAAGGTVGGGGESARLGIRMPPGMRKVENL